MPKMIIRPATKAEMEQGKPDAPTPEVTKADEARAIENLIRRTAIQQRIEIDETRPEATGMVDEPPYR